MYDRPSPRRPRRCSTATRPPLPSAHRSASSPVPSGDPSSTTRTRRSRNASSRSITTGRFARSLYVGTTTVGRIRIRASVLFNAQRGYLFRDETDEEDDDGKQNQQDGAIWKPPGRGEIEQPVEGADRERRATQRHENAQRAEDGDHAQQDEEELGAVAGDAQLRAADAWPRVDRLERHVVARFDES